MSWRATLPPTCWEAVEATRIIPTEAETPPDSVFLATHTSIPVFVRGVVVNAQRAAKTNEDALLQAVKDQPVDQPILPIIGNSGTGKSHLVRWLRAKLPPNKSRRDIFVPKHQMSLRGILDEILKYATGDRADELRRKVANAADGIANEEVAKLRLRGELALLIETQNLNAEGSSEEQDLRKYLASREGLPALLGDDVFRDAFLNDTGPITRLVREKLTGRSAEDKADAFGFTADNLNMSVDDVSRAGAAATDVASNLISAPELREVAATMLNEQLGPAVSQVFGIGGADLRDLLVEVRGDFKRQGLELLLLIEDFSIFQGIQGGLLDAITLIPTQNNDICPMRVVMAVTTGYFRNHMPDTVYTRVYKVFDLDDPQPRISFQPQALVARYLNAIRVGTDDLEQAYTNESVIPNACEQCPVNDACHKAFGAVDGYGLFPFNKNALDKAVKSKVVDERISVRDVLTRVVRPVLLKNHDDIDAETFPTVDFDAEFRTGALGTLDSVEDQHRLATPGDPETSTRRVNLIRYWGPEGTEPRNLSPTIHDAFAVPRLKGLRSPGTPDVPDGKEPDPKPPRPTPPPDRKPNNDPRLISIIDNWNVTGVMLQSVRNELRNLVHGVITARLMFDDGLGGSRRWTDSKKPWDTAFASQLSIKIGDQTVADPLITIDRTDPKAVRTLRALVWFQLTGNWNAVENGEDLQVLVEEQLSLWTDAVERSLVPDRDTRDDTELAATAQALLAVSRALGVPEAFKDDALTRTRALFAPVHISSSLTREKLRVWQQRISQDGHRLSRDQLQSRVLRLASFTQGTGAPQALDVTRITQALRGKESGVNLPTSAGLLGETIKWIEQHHAMLPVLREEAGTRIVDLSALGETLANIIKELDGLVLERAAAGQLPSVINPHALRTAAQAIKPGDQSRVEGARLRLADWDTLSLSDQVRALTDDWDEAAARVEQWYILAITAIDALETRFGGDTKSIAQREYEQAQSKLLDTLHDLVGLLGPAATIKDRT